MNPRPRFRIIMQHLTAASAALASLPSSGSLGTLGALTVHGTAGAPACADESGIDEKLRQAEQRARRSYGELYGLPVFIRIIKEDLELELWCCREGRWSIAKTYPIAGMSGELGPKTQEGDCQAPEGFYRVAPRALNPRSSYHLSFNIGYPNRYDRQLGRTGSLIMIHGKDCSIGCFAMTDPGIEEIYSMVAAALRNGQEGVRVQVYPFRMTDERMQQESDHPHFAFWERLKKGWDYTEQKRAPYPNQDE